jgi:biofilm PGA synthesis protein PgaA
MNNKRVLLKLPVWILVLTLALVCIIPCFLHAVPDEINTHSKEEQHRKAVTLAREGKYDEAASMLAELLKQFPSDKSLLYDTIVVLSWGGKDDNALELFNTIENNNAVPLYVLSAAAQSARRKEKRDLAITLYRRMLELQPGHLPAHIGMGLALAEKGEMEGSFARLKELEQTHPRNIDILFALAYVYQLNRDFFTEMTYYQKILDIEPGNPHAKRGYILSASSLGAPNVALEMIEKERGLELPIAAREQVLGDRAAQMVQWGEVKAETPVKRFEETDMALDLLEQNTARITDDKTIPRRFLYRSYYDRLIALRDRVEMEETVKLYETLLDTDLDIPDYGKIQAADAYLYLSRPQKAREIYEDIFKRNPDHFNTGLSLFYGYLETERYAEAGTHLQEIARKQPEWFHIKGSRVYSDNPRKLSADKTAIMFEAYARRLRKAQLQMEKKSALAPYNRDLRTDLAKLYLWRGWIRKAIRQFNLALAQEPGNMDARIWRTHASLDYHKYEEASETVRKLWSLFPENKAVQKLKRNWDTHHMWYFHSEMMGGKGESLVVGSRDFSIDNYLYSPPVHHWFKGFLHYHNHSAKFFGETARHQRWGVGVDFNRGDFGGQAELLLRLSGDPNYGYRLGGHWNIDDHWEFSADYTHNGLDIPLKGRVVDLKGNSAASNLVWRLSDLTYFKSSFSTYDFNDGNRRYGLLLAGHQLLYMGPKFMLAADAEFYTSSNSMTDRYYFNPESDASYMISLDAWQTLYRFYDFKFVHRLIVGYGNYWQKNYDPGWMGMIRYEHQWDFNDRQALLYGIRFSRRVYDGNPETATAYYVTVNWRF